MTPSRQILICGMPGFGKTMALAALLAEHPDAIVMSREPVQPSFDKIREMAHLIKMPVKAPDIVEDDSPISPREWGMSRACRRMMRKGKH